MTTEQDYEKYLGRTQEGRNILQKIYNELSKIAIVRIINWGYSAVYEETSGKQTFIIPNIPINFDRCDVEKLSMDNWEEYANDVILQIKNHIKNFSKNIVIVFEGFSNMQFGYRNFDGDKKEMMIREEEFNIEREKRFKNVWLTGNILGFSNKDLPAGFKKLMVKQNEKENE